MTGVIDVVVDCLLPVTTDEDGSVPYYTSPRNADTICYGVVEKALGVKVGGYENLAGGNVGECIRELTGVGGIEHSKKLSDVVAEEVGKGSMLSSGYIDTSESGNGRVGGFGVRKNHAYAIISCDKDTVTVYNPHGCSDGFVEKKGGEDLSDGTLKFSWAAFKTCFNRVTVCPYRVSTWNVTRVQRNWAGPGRGSTQCAGFRGNDVAILKMGKGEEVYLGVGQDDRRGGVSASDATRRDATRRDVT